MKTIRLTDSTLRDGLQGCAYVPFETKKQIFDLIYQCAFDVVEVASIVSPRKVPQMRDATELLAYALNRPKQNTVFSALVPNLIGMQKGLELGLKHLSFLCSIDDEFNVTNVNRSTNEIIKEMETLATISRSHATQVRIDIPMSFQDSNSRQAKSRWQNFLNAIVSLGFEQICFADTLGLADEKQIGDLLEIATRFLPLSHLHLHLHNQNHSALDNAIYAIKVGVENLDGTIGGLGGCPFTKKQSANLSLTALIEWMNSHGYHHFADIEMVKESENNLKKLLSIS